MNRALKIQMIYLEEIDKYADVEDRDKPLSWEKIHMASCGRIGYMLAMKRGIDPELGAIACAVHDIGRVISGKQKDHGPCGYEPAKEFLEKTGLVTDEEIEEIAVAVRDHSKKGETGAPLSEIVKDADCLDFHMHGFELPRQEQRDRLAALLDKTVDDLL